MLETYFAIVNTKSIRNKAEEFKVHITEDSIDLTVVLNFMDIIE